MFSASIKVLLAGTLLATAVGWIAEEDSEVARYFELYRKATKAQQAGRHAKALGFADGMVPLAPENPAVHLLRAECLAELGQSDAAFVAIDRAVALRYAWPDTIAQDEWLASLRADPRWAAVFAGFERNETAWLSELSTLHNELPPESAERHDSLETLGAAFDARQLELDARALLLGQPRLLEVQAALFDQRLAAVERLLAQASDPAAREAAALEALRTAASYKEGWQYWDGDAVLVAAKAERFLTDYPQSAHRAQVMLERAVAAWKAHGPDDAETTLVQRSAEAREWLARLEAEHAGSEEAWRSRVWRLAIGHETVAGATTPEQLALYEALAGRMTSDEALADYAWEHARGPLFRIEGERGFDGVDLAGKRWNWEAMRGRVVLIEFWATWCGPCMADVPLLRKVYDTYHDQGFEIVGVSLDGGSRKKFEKKCAERGIVWPQIWDGKGVQAELAHRFRVQSVPTPILLDRQGNVTAVHEDARHEKLVEKVAQLLAGDR